MKPNGADPGGYSSVGKVAARERREAREAAERHRKAVRDGRRGGLQSGKVRRQTAKGRQGARAASQATALALLYPQRQVNKAEFERLFKRAVPNGNVRGMESLYVYYKGVWRKFRACGQHFATTKPQSARRMEKDGRARSPRQVRRYNILLEQMGLAVTKHVRRLGATPGRRDYLRVEVRSPKPNPCFVTRSPKGGRHKAAIQAAALCLPSQTSTFPPRAGHDGRQRQRTASERERLALRERKRLIHAMSDPANWQLREAYERSKAAGTDPPLLRDVRAGSPSDRREPGRTLGLRDDEGDLSRASWPAADRPSDGATEGILGGDEARREPPDRRGGASILDYLDTLPFDEWKI